MSDYTPTTEWVIAGWMKARASDGITAGIAFEEINRWLAEVKTQAIVEDRAQLLDIAKGNLKGCSGYGCDECESVMFIDDIVVQRQIMSGEVREVDE